jgi:hypothetical protein
MKKEIIRPIIEALKEIHQPRAAADPERPMQPAELDQDAGGGYNSDHTYPQS